MLKKIAISQVRIGMCIHSVEGSWLTHSLWKTRFVIEGNEQLVRVQNCGATECWIDASQGEDLIPLQQKHGKLDGYSHTVSPFLAIESIDIFKERRH